MSKTTTGLSENVASALAYAFSWIGGIVFYVIEKENKVVRFNALQSICFFLPFGVLTSVVGWLIGWVPFVGGIVTGALGIASLIAWIYMTYTAYTGKIFKIPFIGDACWNQVNK